MDIKYIFLSNSLPFEESGYSPQMSRKLVKLLPLGLVHSTKGDFLVDHESFRSIRNRFMERQLQIPIDYEHQTLQDVQAPAAGWIKNIVLRNDGTITLWPSAASPTALSGTGWFLTRIFGST